jgi:glucosylceramidase
MTRWKQLVGLWMITLIAVAIRPAGAVNVWLTTGDKSQLLCQKTDILCQPGTGSGGVAIVVYAATSFQTISGFDAAMTDSSAWLLQNELSEAQRNKLMRQMFPANRGLGSAIYAYP